MGTAGCWVLSVVGMSVMLSAAASMVLLCLYRASTDSYVVNLNHFWCCLSDKSSRVVSLSLSQLAHKFKM